MSIQENKELVLNLYAEAVESHCPGKGASAREIMSQGWDYEADYFCDPARLSAMGYAINTQFAMNCMNGIAKRNPELNEKLKALK